MDCTQKFYFLFFSERVDSYCSQVDSSFVPLDTNMLKSNQNLSKLTQNLSVLFFSYFFILNLNFSILVLPNDIFFFQIYFLHNELFKLMRTCSFKSFRLASGENFFIDDFLIVSIWKILHPSLKHMISTIITQNFEIIKINHRVNN